MERWKLSLRALRRARASSSRTKALPEEPDVIARRGVRASLRPGAAPGAARLASPASMRISVPTEIASREQRVALPPDSAGRLVKSGLEVVVQRGAGRHAGFRDDAYTTVGARIVPDARSALANSDVVVKVQPPTSGEIAEMSEGTSLISLMRPGQHHETATALAGRKIDALALELVPR